MRTAITLAAIGAMDYMGALGETQPRSVTTFLVVLVFIAIVQDLVYIARKVR